MQSFPLIHLQGTSRSQIGLLHGTLLRDRIVAAWSYYRHCLRALTDSQIESACIRIGHHIQELFPQIFTELQGIAEGAELALWKVIGINARTELLHLADQPHQECTALYFPTSKILGENWDFAKQLESLAIILRIELEGTTILTLTEPGMVGKIGLNSHGVGVCVNRLCCKGELDGIPTHILLRLVLESRSFNEACRILEETPSGAESNILVADDQGNGRSFEFAGSKRTIVPEGLPVLVHTNHYIAEPSWGEISAEDFDQSNVRLLRAQRLLGENNDESWKTMRDILFDSTDENYPICRRYTPDEELGEAGTVAMVIMDLPRRVLYFTPGNPLNKPFESVSIS